MNPDGGHYNLIYVNEVNAKAEECIDETKTLREIKPFQNLLKFCKKTKENDNQYKLRAKIGKSEVFLIQGFEISSFNLL